MLPYWLNQLLRIKKPGAAFENFPCIDDQAVLLHRTPFFITDTHIIEKKILAFKKYFTPKKIPYRLAFSFKTNYDIARSTVIKNNGLFAEVVSDKEFKLALKQKYDSPNIIYNGPNKKNIPALCRLPIHLHLDNISEIHQLLKLSPSVIKAKIGLRVNTVSRPSRFGFNLETGEALKMAKLLTDNGFPPSSLHIHLGSNCYQPEDYRRASISISKFIKSIDKDFGITIKYLDFGGGYPAHGLPPYGSRLSSVPSIESFLDAITEPLTFELEKLPVLMFEPGRFLVDDSTALVSRVINSVNKGKKQILTLDSTINMLPSAWYRPLIVKTINKEPTKKGYELLSTIYGASCQENDRLFSGKLPPSNVGDYIIFYCVGAYNQSMAPDFIFSKPDTIFI